MDNWQVWLLIAVVAVLLGGTALVTVAVKRKKQVTAQPRPSEVAQSPQEAPPQEKAQTDTLAPPEAPTETAPETKTAPEQTPQVDTPEVETPEPTAGRLVRLRSRLSRSNNAIGRGMLSLLSRDHLSEDDWEELEDTLLSADVGLEATQEIVERIRERTKVLGTRTPEELRSLLTQELEDALSTDQSRALNVSPDADRPTVVLVVGVNGAGKTTTCGKIARVMIADGHSVLLGAADTFRAAAADQLETWANRVGSQVVRGPEGGDPASVAFDAVSTAIKNEVDSVLVDTAGRLQNKSGLMDELGKVKRVIEKQGPVDETLLILDATTGQNGLEQARVFTEVCDVSGVVLTKMDGTAKGGIVIAVQRRLGVPVKLIGLGEGPDDLALFDVKEFVSALLDDDLGNGKAAAVS